MNYFISQKGIQPTPYPVPPGQLVVEWLTAGQVQHPETERLCSPGTIFIHQENQKTVHRSLPDRHYECVALKFDLSALPRPPAWPRSLYWAEEQGSLAFIREMLHSHHHHSVPLDILGPLIWAQVQYRLAGPSAKPAPVPPRIAESLKLMKQEISHPLPVEVLAKKVGLSPSHFHARFRDAMHQTPYQYLVHLRMRAARLRLVTTSDPVKAIAADVGYANTENFCRAFKKDTGMTAARFRKQHQKFPFSF